MKAKLIVEGKEFPIEILDPELQKLLAPPKKTGYERVNEGQKYWLAYSDGDICWSNEYSDNDSNKNYEVANYYSSENLAKNNARADKLMRQLRRFAVEHRENNSPVERWYIYYAKDPGILQLRRDSKNYFCGPWFDSLHAGSQAIEKFNDELIWYFTEYKDSL